MDCLTTQRPPINGTVMGPPIMECGVLYIGLVERDICETACFYLNQTPCLRQEFNNWITIPHTNISRSLSDNFASSKSSCELSANFTLTHISRYASTIGASLILDPALEVKCGLLPTNSNRPCRIFYNLALKFTLSAKNG